MTFSDQETLARTLWGEARGEGVAGILAVANVIRNRVFHPKIRWWGTGWEGVCRAAWQFSCWNPNDPNAAALMGPDGPKDGWPIAICRAVAAEAIAGRLGQDNSCGADGYHASSIQPPSWAKGMKPVANIGRHVFYRVN